MARRSKDVIVTRSMKIVTVVGARPQFVKAGILSNEFSKHPSIEEIIVHTGQHFDANMSKVFFEEMGIPKPHYNLGIHSKTHGAMTGAMLTALEEVLIQEQPDYLLVYGDTNSTLAGALAAKKLHIGVIHVEAGLRSFNMQMPEEINRILTDRISDILFCPTEAAIQNLHAEGFDKMDCEMVNSGDVMFDASLHYLERSNEQSTIIDDLGLSTTPFALCTIHRSENTDDPERLRAIVNGLNDLAREYTIITPLHPRTRNIIQKEQLVVEFKIIDPVGYLDIVQLLKHTKLVVTDSGGLQKEAFFLNKYCITLRDQTEWVELVDNQVNSLVGADTEKIVHEFRKRFGATINNGTSPYGNGDACQNICNVLLAKIP